MHINNLMLSFTSALFQKSSWSKNSYRRNHYIAKLNCRWSHDCMLLKMHSTETSLVGLGVLWGFHGFWGFFWFFKNLFCFGVFVLFCFVLFFDFIFFWWGSTIYIFNLPRPSRKHSAAILYKERVLIYSLIIHFL